MSRLGASTLAFVLVQFGWAAPALAGAFHTARYTGEHGHPTTENATSIYWNPGAMTRGPRGTHGLFDINVAFRRVTYFHPYAPPAGSSGGDDVPADAPDANLGRAELFNVFGAPTIGVIARPSEKFAIGGLIHGPFGGMLQFSENENFKNHPRYAGPVDGPARWHSITGSLASVYLSAGAAYEFGEVFSAGLALNLIRSSVETLIARNPDGTNDVESEGRASLNVSGWQWSFALGLMLEPVKNKLWLGLSYQAQPNVSGGMVLEGEQRTAFRPGQPPSTIDANLHQTYPDIYRIGLTYRAQPQIELRLFGALERWSVTTDQCVTAAGANCELDENGATIPNTGSNVVLNAKRDWSDTFGIRGGVSYWTNPERTTELFGGLGFDSNAVPDATLEASLPDSHRLAGSLGVRGALGKSIHVAGSYTHMHYLGRNNIGNSELPQYGGQSKFPDAGGVYNSWIGIVNANIEVAF